MELPRLYSFVDESDENKFMIEVQIGQKIKLVDLICTGNIEFQLMLDLMGISPDDEFYELQIFNVEIKPLLKINELK